MCKKIHTTTQEEMIALNINKPEKIYSPEGCQYCNGSGYKGRLAVHEIMYVNDKLRALINQNASVEDVRNLALKNGMITLSDSCKTAVLNGQTSMQEFMAINISEDEEK